MRRWLNILVLIVLSISVFGQEETQVVDSLLNVLPAQEGREKVLTMIELTWEFHDVSYDDCLSWGERAIKEAQDLGFEDLEAKSNYALGIQYAYHGDLDLAKDYLQRSYDQFIALGDEQNAFESVWNIATYEMTLGSIDTAYAVYENALRLAEQMRDTSARAFVLSNMGLIKYYGGQIDDSYEAYIEAEHLFRLLGDDLRTARMESSLATIFVDRGQIDKAKSLFKKIIPVFEDYGDNYHLLGVYKNLGHIFQYETINYDSAMYYMQKSLECADMTSLNKNSEVFAKNEKSNVITEMGNVLMSLGDYAGAIKHYEEALRLAESSAYLHGQQTAFQALGKIYSKMGNASKSLLYYRRFMALEDASGIVSMRSLIRIPLAMDYARLGLFDDLQKDLESFEEEYAALAREVADLYEQNDILQQSNDDLLIDHVENSKQIAELQSQRDQYRLAFFGILAMVLSVLVLLVLYKIVRKKNSNV